MRRFEGRIALVTGAAGGIGGAICTRLRSEGATVIGCDLGEAEGIVALDVAREEAWAGLAADVAARHGRVDVLVNCAGTLGLGTIEQTTPAEWDRLLQVNLTGAYLGCRAMMPLLRRGRGGNIVNIASIIGLRANPGMLAYAASKGGLVAMTVALALDAAAEGLRVNAVCPGSIDTVMAGRFMAAAPDPAGARAASAAKHPLNRMGTPEEVAAVVAFLASDDAAFVTGVALPVDGGRSIR